MPAPVNLSGSKSSIVLAIVLRLFAAGVFIFSAISKLLSIDSFDLYIYSQDFIGPDLSAVAARLIISVEMALGLFLIVGVHFRIVCRLSLYLLVFFSLFLLFKLLTASAGNCHCFGSLLIMRPGASLLKNIIIILFIVILIKLDRQNHSRSALITTGILCLSFALPPVISPPDFIYRRAHPDSFTIENKTPLAFSDTILDVNTGKKALVFLSTTCKYCLLAAQKISLIADRTGTHEHINYVFAGGAENLDAFWEKSQSKRFNHTIIDAAEAGRLTQGHLPSVIFTDSGYLVARFSYRSLSEKLFDDFFNNR